MKSNGIRKDELLQHELAVAQRNTVATRCRIAQIDRGRCGPILCDVRANHTTQFTEFADRDTYTSFA